MNLQAFEDAIVKDINAAPAILTKIKTGIAAIKASPAQSLAEKLWPGIGAFEDTVLKDIDFLSSLDAELITWLSILFPKS